MIYQLLGLTVATLVGLVGYLGIRRTGVLLLSLYKKSQIIWLQLKGSSPSKEIERKVVAGRAWEEYCDTLKAAGSTLFAPGAPMTPFDQAEGYRYLTRLLRVSLSSFMECKDYNRPKLIAVSNGFLKNPVKIGSDNPDNLYEAAIVSGRKAYLLTVLPNTVHYLSIGTQSGMYGQPGGLQTVDSKEINDFETHTGTDGKERVEVLVSPVNYNESKNWLKLDPVVVGGIVIVRQTFNDRKQETPAAVDIKKVADFDYDEDKKALSSPILVQDSDVLDAVDVNDLFGDQDKFSCEQLVEALEASSLFVAGASLMFANWASGFQKHVNKLPLFDVDRSNKVGGDPSIRYYHSYWRLEDDEALVITATPPEGVFTWNFQVNNHWMESLDYRYFRIHVNQALASYRRDKSVCIVLTLKNPKKILEATGASDDTVEPYNWLSTTGHNCGTMCFRWVRPRDFNNLPQPQTTVCKVEDLPKYLCRQ